MGHWIPPFRAPVCYLLDALIYLVKLTLLLWNGDMSFSTLCFIHMLGGKEGTL